MHKFVTQEYEFHGKPFQAIVPTHPSEFNDEVETRDMFWRIKPNDIVLDVGCSFGSYTLTALAVGAGFVYSWSPDVKIHEKDYVEASLVANGWQDKCTVYDTAVWNKTGYLDLEGVLKNSEYQLFFEENPGDQVGYITQVESLDTWVDRVKPDNVHWIKLDVEAAEVEVLQGSKDLITRFKPMILVENHVCYRKTIEQEVRALLTSSDYGYKEEATRPHYYLPNTYAVSHSLYYP